MIMQALEAMLFGMVGIFIVMGIIIGVVKVLSSSNKKGNE